MKNYHILAVCSGKGGVGKSTLSFYLASLLADLNFKVGLIDADIYGPSLHLLFGDSLQNQKPENHGHLCKPACIGSVRFMSAAFLAPGGAFIRAPKATAIVKSFFDCVDWGDIDILIVDFPPGTGDVSLTLFQEVSFDGALVVTTPHTLSVEDASKSCVHLQKSGIEIFGVVENMSYMEVGSSLIYPFGQGGADELCQLLNLTKLQALPLMVQDDLALSGMKTYLAPLVQVLEKKLLKSKKLCCK